jgi:excisionase family DNA binding protein
MEQSFTAEEVARMLAVPVQRVYDMARQQLIPSFKCGRQVRFSPDALRNWMSSGGTSLSGPGGWRKAR